MSEDQSNINTFSSVTDAKPFVPSVKRKTTLKTNAAPFVPSFKSSTEGESTPREFTPMQSQFIQPSVPIAGYGYDVDGGYEDDPQDMYYYYQDMNDQQEDPLNTPFVFPPPNRRLVKSVFIPSDIQRYYEMETAAIIDQEPPSDPHYKQIPNRYQSLKKLDSTMSDNTTGSFGYISSTYKVIDKKDGYPYLLRRFERVRTTNEQTEYVLNAWRTVPHPNIVALRDCYLYNGALFFIHDYYPNAQSIAKRYCSEKSPPLLEDLLWFIVVQILLALSAIHSKGLACRSVDTLHILDTGRNRFRLSSCGINDVLDPSSSYQDEQINDLRNLGRVMLILGGVSNGKANINTFGAIYSRDLTILVDNLLSGTINCSQAIKLCLPQVLRVLNYSFMSNDYLSNCLGTEINNSRYLRMLIKLGFINERPSLMGNTYWSETGDRYILKLFRDYLFHQEDENGIPNLDVGHVFDTLSKLDVGFNEQIALHSRDGKTFLICNYNDIKRALESVFLELKDRSTYGTSSLPISASTNSLNYSTSLLSPMSTMSTSSAHMAPVMQPVSMPVNPMISPVQTLPKSLSPTVLSPSSTSRAIPTMSVGMTGPLNSNLPMNMGTNLSSISGPMSTPSLSGPSGPMSRYPTETQYSQTIPGYSHVDHWRNY